MNNNEVTAVLGSKWRELTPEQRLPYVEKSAALKASYEAQQKLESPPLAPKLISRKRQTKKDNSAVSCLVVEATNVAKEGGLKRKKWFVQKVFLSVSFISST
jgi:hypothetical protein